MFVARRVVYTGLHLIRGSAMPGMVKEGMNGSNKIRISSSSMSGWYLKILATLFSDMSTASAIYYVVFVVMSHLASA